MRTAVTLVFLCSASAVAAEEETLPTDPSVKVSSSSRAAAKQLQVDIRSINSKLTDPRKQRFTDVSETVQKYIPTGSTLDAAEALMLAMGCKPPLRFGVGQSPPHGYRRPSCTAIVTVKPDKSQSLGAQLELPGGFLQGHWLSIDAQATGTDRRITSVNATIDIRTVDDAAASPITDCNQPASEPIAWVDLPGTNAFQALPSNDGCWIFLSLAPDDVAASAANPAAQIAVFSRKAGRITLSRVVHVGGTPSGMALTHDGRVLVVADGNRVGFFDTERLVSGKRDPALGYWNDGAKFSGRVYVTITSDNSYLFVSDEFADTVTVINLARAEASRFAATATVGRIPVGDGPIAVTLSKDEKYLFVTSLSMPSSPEWPPECRPDRKPQGALFVVDVATAKTDPARAVVATVRAGCEPVRLVLSPQGDVAYVSARGDDLLLAFDTTKLIQDPTRALLGKVPTGTSPIGISVIDNGTKIVVANSNRFGRSPSAHQSLSVIDANRIGAGSAAILGSIPAGDFPREMSLSSDLQTLFVVNTNSKTLEIIDLARLPMRPVP
jgi:DNA-binding beta-propeller fold protein YncE